MGFICFRYRKENQKTIFTNFLNDSSITDDCLLGLLTGDLMELNLEVQENIYNTLVRENRVGVKVQERLPKMEGEPARYEAVIECRIVNREHSVYRDWTMEHQMGFRLSTTTIIVEATSDEAESLVIDLQEQFNDQLSKHFGV